MRFSRLLMPALLMLALMVPTVPSPSQAAVSIGISVGFAPPALPVYDQPPIPGDGYVWMPGYWAWGPNGYYWVPGTWVLPPGIGLYWTPPWWGWNGAAYVFHAGYWGPSVGYYGGINYGHGYFGSGYEGGYWRDRHFYYNREYNNFGHRNIPRTYSKPFHRPEHNGIGWNGGVGGMPGHPDAKDRIIAPQHRVQAPRPQIQHFDTARKFPQLRANTNNGNPPIVTTNRAGRFNNTGVVRGGQRGGGLRGSPSEPSRN